MFVVTVLYPASDGAKFDFDYYMNSHIPLVKRLWSGLGLDDLRVLRGAPGLDGSAPRFLVIAVLTFKAAEDFQAAARAHGKEIFADIPKFTDIPAVMQLNDVLG